MRIVFMGTPDIAAQSLAELLSDGFEVVAAYTRADKPVGRRQVLTAPPVKVLAAENRIPVLQPDTLKGPDAEAQLRAFAPDLVVVVAYGRLLPPALLAVPKCGCINLHVSMLPHYRGAAPIQWAIINGEEKTGLTVMQLDEGLDTGPILMQQALDIPPEATAGEMFAMVGRIGGRLLCEAVRSIQAGTAQLTPQQGEPSFAPPLKKEMARLDFTRPAAELHNLVRGANPWPLAWFEHAGRRVKLLRTKLAPGAGAPGEVLETTPLVVACGEGALEFGHLLPAGSRAMTGAEWAAGCRFKAGDRIG